MQFIQGLGLDQVLRELARLRKARTAVVSRAEEAAKPRNASYRLFFDKSATLEAP